MLYGYARVSSTEQETTLQRDAMRRAGVRRVFEEKRSAVFDTGSDQRRWGAVSQPH